MKNLHSLIKLAAVIILLPGSLHAGALFDPFIQDFQVGAFSDPAEIELIQDYPATLMTPARPDTLWLRAGLRILAQDIQPNSPHLTLRLLAEVGHQEDATSWIRWHDLRLRQLEARQDTLDLSGRYLLAERMALGFFQALHRNDYSGAEHLAARLSRESDDLSLTAREAFVWDLRRRWVREKRGKDREAGFWGPILDLGTFDTATAWNLWAAHRRHTGQALLPPELDTRAEAAELAALRQSGLTRDDIRASRFPLDVKIGLGAKLLKGEERQGLMRDYPRPPSNSQLQGWWAFGQRMAQRGVTAHYERLAADTDLNATWRLDIWRRASEIHLLARRWEPGLKDLQQALDLAAQGAGSKGHRRRLRQWCEQSLVLAVAAGKEDTARDIRQRALVAFKGEEGDLLRKETRNWFDDGETSPVQGEDRRERALQFVETGEVADLQPVSEDRRGQFLTVSGEPQWRLWARWGLSVLDEKGGGSALATYRRALERVGAEKDPTVQEQLVVAAISPLLGGTLPREDILRWTLDKDIHHLTGGQSLTGTSGIAKLTATRRSQPLALHALLGLALLTDDLRGVVGAATPLPRGSLTSDEKLCFLYPLPRDGAVHRALAASENDPALLLAVARNESLFEPSIRSRAGALGFMQIMPFHLPRGGANPGPENWGNAAVSLAKGDALMTENRRRYDGNPYLSLAAYNAGPGAVARWQKQLGDNERNDIFLAWIGYPETRLYVEKVLKDREIYDWILREGRGDQLNSAPADPSADPTKE